MVRYGEERVGHEATFDFAGVEVSPFGEILGIVPGRRTGAIMLIDGAGRLKGLFTDSDLARLFEHGRQDQFDRPIRDVMTVDPVTVQVGSKS